MVEDIQTENWLIRQIQIIDIEKNGNSYIESRMKYQKHKLINILKNFDKNKTEWENMQDNGYTRIWDCGNLKFKYKT